MHGREPSGVDLYGVPKVCREHHGRLGRNRHMEMYIPKEIEKRIEGESYWLDDVGMSESTVILLKDKVLKIQPDNEETRNEYEMMEWLQGKLPVPKVISFVREDDKNYLLMSRMPGEMSCQEEYMDHPKQLTAALAEALKMLWQVDITDCPAVYDVDKKLRMARYNVENNLVDLDNVEPGTFGEGGFENPKALLEWLIANRPEEEKVLVHGDFCLPNVFLQDGRVSGFIDIGKTGIADKWQDIALCYRSLCHNYGGNFGGKVYEDFDPNILFENLGIEPDWEKIRYYILMDELF